MFSNHDKPLDLCSNHQPPKKPHPSETRLGLHGSLPTMHNFVANPTSPPSPPPGMTVQTTNLKPMKQILFWCVVGPILKPHLHPRRDRVLPTPLLPPPLPCL